MELYSTYALETGFSHLAQLLWSSPSWQVYRLSVPFYCWGVFHHVNFHSVSVHKRHLWTTFEWSTYNHSGAAFYVNWSFQFSRVIPENRVAGRRLRVKLCLGIAVPLCSPATELHWTELCSPPSSVWECQCSAPSSLLGAVTAVWKGALRCPVMVFIGIPLVANNVKHLFMCLLFFIVSSLRK